MFFDIDYGTYKTVSGKVQPVFLVYKSGTQKAEVIGCDLPKLMSELGADVATGVDLFVQLLYLEHYWQPAI